LHFLPRFDQKPRSLDSSVSFLGTPSCSLFTHGGAETAADEAEHSDEGGDPEAESHVEVVGHRPDVSRSHCFRHGAGADSIVFSEHHSAHGNESSELEQADAESAVDGADSSPCSPGADEHENSVQGDQSIDGAHKASDGGQLGALGLAVNIAILEQVNVVLQPVSVQVLISPVH